MFRTFLFLDDTVEEDTVYLVFQAVQASQQGKKDKIGR